MFECVINPYFKFTLQVLVLILMIHGKKWLHIFMIALNGFVNPKRATLPFKPNVMTVTGKLASLNRS